MTAIPSLYFRIRDNGAVVFRIDTENRDRRLEYEQIAVVNTNRADYKTHGDHVLSAQEQEEIAAWIHARIAVLAARDADNILRTVDQMNLMAQWAQSKATDAQLADMTDDILIAIHDLRSVLVRKKADRLNRT